MQGGTNHHEQQEKRRNGPLHSEGGKNERRIVLIRTTRVRNHGSVQKQKDECCRNLAYIERLFLIMLQGKTRILSGSV